MRNRFHVKLPSILGKGQPSNWHTAFIILYQEILQAIVNLSKVSISHLIDKFLSKLTPNQHRANRKEFLRERICRNISETYGR